MSVTKPNHCDYSNINVNHMYSCFLEQKQGSCTRILHCLLLLKYVVCLSGHEGIRFNIIPGRAGQFNKTASLEMFCQNNKSRPARSHQGRGRGRRSDLLSALVSGLQRASFLWVSCFNQTPKPVNIIQVFVVIAQSHQAQQCNNIKLSHVGTTHN